MPPLDTTTLSSLDGAVPTPTYDPEPGAHGHRPHRHGRISPRPPGDVPRPDDERGAGVDWGICGVGVLASDRKMSRCMDAQDGLYTLVVKHPDGTYEPRVWGRSWSTCSRPDDPGGGHREDGGPEPTGSFADGHGRRVQLLSGVTGEFDAGHPDVVPTSAGAAPRTTFGLVTERWCGAVSGGWPPSPS